LFAGLPTNPFGQPASSPVVADSSDDFNLKMRGLNKSFVDSANKLLERSPSADFTKLFEQYSKHLASISGLNPSKSSAVPFAKPTSSFAPPVLPGKTESIAINNQKEDQKMMDFSSIAPSSAIETKPASFETKPFSFETKPASFEAKPFSFEAKPTSFEAKPTSLETKPSFTFEAKPVQASFESKPFAFEANKPAELVAFESKPTTNTEEKFTDSDVSSDVKHVSEVIDTKEPAPSFKPFSFGNNNASTSESTAKPFNFGSTNSAFSFGGPSSSAPTTAFSFTPKEPVVEEKEKEKEKPTSTFNFGTTEASGKSSIAETPKFSFGSSTTATTEAPKFSFGSGGLSAPLPAFNFGSSATTGSSGGFSFTAPTSTTEKQQSGDEDNEIPPEEAESFTLTRTNSEHLKTGAGEENETCQYEERCKVFMMDSTGSNGWIDLGIGIFKINRYNNETGKSRILCRTEGSGKVILNSLVSVPGMDVSSTEGKKEVALLTIGSEGKPTKYLIRVKTLDQAGSLKAAILSEIEYVKSSKQ
jgi:hypothetical protein